MWIVLEKFARGNHVEAITLHLKEREEKRSLCELRIPLGGEFHEVN